MKKNRTNHYKALQPGAECRVVEEGRKAADVELNLATG